ncbi:MAG TPA: ABC transporter permease [Ignavibacteriaceae bacterium]|nr:ABC transporter permease [Ignavibacteriaceae bacterium]
MADVFISAILIFISPILIFFRRNKVKLLGGKIGFTSVAIILLLFFFIFSPLIATVNPEFQKNLNVTKLLPPLSKLKVLHLTEVENRKQNHLAEFLENKNKVVKRSFEDEIIFIDSLKLISKDSTIYFQNNNVIEVEEGKIEFIGGKPEISERIFILGTDELGRDTFSRLVYGTRVSLLVGLGAVIISLLLGLSLGFLAGFTSGIIDTILSRITDMLLAFPMIFLIILILALFGNSLFAVIIVLGFTGWMSLFKIVRGEVISIKGKEFFISAKMIGLSNFNLLKNEILPVIAASVIVNLIFQYGNVILAEAALSFLGLGTGGSYPSWGQMIEAGQSYLTSGWWMILFPGLILFITLFAANNLGKEINVYFNPAMKK